MNNLKRKTKIIQKKSALLQIMFNFVTDLQERMNKISDIGCS